MDLVISVFFLVVICLFCFYDIYRFYIYDGFLSLRTIFVLVFCFIYVFSGFSHLLVNVDGVRGFFDSVYHSMLHGGIVNTLSSIAVLVFYLFLRKGLYYTALNKSKQPTGTTELGFFRSDSFVFFYSLMFILLGAFGYSVLASTIDLSVLERGRQLPPGVAKFVFMAGWLVWGVTLMFYFVLSKSRTTFMDFVFFTTAMVMIVGSVLWQGGRSIIVLTSFPVLFVFLKKHKRATLPVVLFCCLSMISYISFVSGIRKEGYTNDSTTFWEVLDWEYGRFSMVAYSFDYVYRNGFEGVGVLFDALVKILCSPLYLAGLGAEFVGSYEGSTIAFIGQDLFADSTATYVVPGIISELIVGSFGIFIPVFAFYSGAIVAFLQRYTFNYRPNDSNYVFSVFLFSIITFNFLNSTFYAFLNYLIFIGFPIFFIGVVRLYLKIKLRLNS